MKEGQIIRKTYRDVIRENPDTRVLLGKSFFVGDFSYFLMTFFGTLAGSVIAIVFISVT